VLASVGFGEPDDLPRIYFARFKIGFVCGNNPCICFQNMLINA
jgi:hypothetical protein